MWKLRTGGEDFEKKEGMNTNMKEVADRKRIRTKSKLNVRRATRLRASLKKRSSITLIRIESASNLEAPTTHYGLSRNAFWTSEKKRQGQRE